MTQNTRVAFRNYNKQNPQVYDLFKKYSEEMYSTGRRKYSAWNVIGRIRWQYDRKTKGNKFKINNDFIALFTRKLIAEQPKFKKFFNTKPLKKLTF